MATRTVTMSVCDLCGKPAEKLNNSLKFNEFEYAEVCDKCAARLGKLISQIQIPPVSPYQRRKAKLAEEKK